MAMIFFMAMVLLVTLYTDDLCAPSPGQSVYSINVVYEKKHAQLRLEYRSRMARHVPEGYQPVDVWVCPFCPQDQRLLSVSIVGTDSPAVGVLHEEPTCSSYQDLDVMQYLAACRKRFAG